LNPLQILQRLYDGAGHKDIGMLKTVDGAIFRSGDCTLEYMDLGRGEDAWEVCDGLTTTDHGNLAEAVDAFALACKNRLAGA
jgi:hypothetical protein